MKNIVTHYAGSHAYGTNTADSDVDVRGIFVADRKHICTPFYPFKEKVGDGEDEKYYELCNYIHLYTQGNPNIIESLWVDESDIINYTPEYSLLKQYRKELLSKKVAFTFTGYAISQLKRIKGHNKWINNPQPVEPPKHSQFIKMVQNFTERKIMPNQFDLNTVADMGLVHYSSNIYGIVDDASLPKVIDKSGEFNISVKQQEFPKTKTPPSFIVKYCREEYLKAKDNHHNYWQWKDNRNEKRSLLEEQHGYDTKHAHHLVRLLRMGEEILSKGEVVVKRPDAGELLAIRNGVLTYEEIIDYAESKDVYIRDVLYKESTLPKNPNLKLAADLIMEIQDRVWND